MHTKSDFRETEPSVTHEIVIRPAVPDDAETAVSLIYLPMGRLADHLFGGDDPEEAREVLRQLFVRERNRFSYQHCDILEWDGQKAGLLLSYPARHLRRMSFPMARHLLSILGLAGMARFIERSRPFIGLSEAELDEHYVFTLAIVPEFQSKGLGKRLLLHGEKKARLNGLLKVSLGVTIGNTNAVRFYERCGYERVETVQIPELDQAIGYPGYQKMIHHLPALG